jgi:exoribonuclease-2
MNDHHQPSKHIDLYAIARRTMIENGFETELPPAAAAEIKQLKSTSPKPLPSTKDLRSLLWSSIDDQKSKDLDQIEFAERLPNDDIRVLIGIADVDLLVKKDSAVDAHAQKNSTSVYTGVKTFHMLPEELSTQQTSLLSGADRLAVITEMTVAPDGTVNHKDVYEALVHNYAKLSYEGVGAWLDRRGPIPGEIKSVAGMEEQIQLQREAARRLRELRLAQGALELETIKAVPVVDEDGRVVKLDVTESNTARDIIENFMIAANVAMAEFLESKSVPMLRRVVRTPAHWDRIVELADELGEKLPGQPDSRALARLLERRKKADPDHYPDLSLSIVKLLGPGDYTVQTASSLEEEGHFGLAVNDYTHSTAPNRRFADLVTQRAVKATLQNAPPPYADTELNAIADHCTEREGAARKVERKMRKVAAALMLQNRIGEVFPAIVTGVSDKGTFARTLRPPVDGRIVRGEGGLRVGDKTRVQLLSTEPERGYIDFSRE